MMISPTVSVEGIQEGVLPVDARFIVETRELEIEFNIGSRYRWPVDSLEMKTRTTDGWQPIARPDNEHLMNVEVWNNGEVVEFTDIEQCFSIPGLMRGRLGSEKWMQRILGIQLRS